MISLSGHGQVLCFTTATGVTVAHLAEEAACDIELAAVQRVFAFDDQAWVISGVGGAPTIHRYTPEGVAIGEPMKLSGLGPQPTIRAASLGAPAVLLSGTRTLEVRDDCGQLVTDDLGAGLSACCPLAPRTWIAARKGRVWLRSPAGEVAIEIPVDLEGRAALESAHALYDGTAAVLELRDPTTTTLLVVDLRRGSVRRRFRIDDVSRFWAVQKCAQAMLLKGDRQLVVIDLHEGTILKQWSAADPITDVAVDHEGGSIAIERQSRNGQPTHVLADYKEWLASGPATASALDPSNSTSSIEQPPVMKRLGRATVTPGLGGPRESFIPDVVSQEIPAAHELNEPLVPAEGTPEGPRRAEHEIHIPGSLVALRPRASLLPLGEDALVENLEYCLELVAAWCKEAIAVGWDSGRLAIPSPGDLPFASEVRAILDGTTGHATDELRQAKKRTDEIERTWSSRRRERAKVAAGDGQGDGAGATRETPLTLLMNEFGLSDLASQILLVVAAPLLWGELARPYGIVANDPARPLSDELLVGQIIGPERASRREIARELDPDRPLMRFGLIETGAGLRPFAPLTVPGVVIARLWGQESLPTARGAVSVRLSDRRLDELRIPAELIMEMLDALCSEPEEGHLRLVVRGRLGSGRRTLLASLAALAHRTLEVIEVPLLLRGQRSASELLRLELRDALLRGSLPCVSGSEFLASDDPVVLEQIREVFRSHPGPLVFRGAAAVTPPLDPGHLSFDLPLSSEEVRAAAWRTSLERNGLPADLADDLAARHRIGPGTMERIARQARGRLSAARPGEVPLLVEQALRQHRNGRIGAVATRVTRLDSWSKLVLPPELIDSLREFIGRVRHRRTVYERWGFDRLVTSARGLTALFEGGPGTGKTMVAGIIARELGYELYRIDLGKVLSKWIGETEKNLGAVFDAAEEGEVVLVFDEADALFARRTDVKTSVDRYANAEVNYLLQRIDNFEGIAVLTTNFGTTIDPAFKRRLSLRLTFPFPDEDMQERLWRAHLPPGLPIEGKLDFKTLAKRYQLSGGYIRNTVLRAAFLAAQDDRPISQSHLERALHLEYREQGKLLEGGVLE